MNVINPVFEAQKNSQKKQKKKERRKEKIIPNWQTHIPNGTTKLTTFFFVGLLISLSLYSTWFFLGVLFTFFTLINFFLWILSSDSSSHFDVDQSFEEIINEERKPNNIYDKIFTSKEWKDEIPTSFLSFKPLKELEEQPDHPVWLNLLLNKILSEHFQSVPWREKIEKKLNKEIWIDRHKLPNFIGKVWFHSLCLGGKFDVSKITLLYPKPNIEAMGTFRLKYTPQSNSDIKFKVYVELVINFPVPQFAVIPITLSVRLVLLNGLLICEIPFGDNPVCRASFLAKPLLKIHFGTEIADLKLLKNIQKVSDVIEKQIHDFVQKELVGINSGGFCFHLPIEGIRKLKIKTWSAYQKSLGKDKPLPPEPKFPENLKSSETPPILPKKEEKGDDERLNEETKLHQILENIQIPTKDLSEKNLKNPFEKLEELIDLGEEKEGFSNQEKRESLENPPTLPERKSAPPTLPEKKSAPSKNENQTSPNLEKKRESLENPPTLPERNQNTISSLGNPPNLPERKNPIYSQKSQSTSSTTTPLFTDKESLTIFNEWAKPQVPPREKNKTIDKNDNEKFHKNEEIPSLPQKSPPVPEKENTND